MASTPPKMDIEPPSVSVFVRPLEVSVPVLDSPPLPPSNPPPKTYISTMTSRIETETSIKRWSTPQVKHEEGQPPGPEDHPETREGKKLEGNVKTITPSYKLGEDKPVHDIRLGTAGYLPSGTGDYKVSMRQEDYKQTVIDPKVRSNANMPLSSMKLPDARRTLADDFPSEHSKRSQIKLEPLEQRRFKSVERRPVSTSSYLTESMNRHRDADRSILHPYLKAKEGDASKPWEKPNWPGPKKNADDEKMRELEIMKQKLETISKKAKASSMYNLSILSPDEFGKTIVVDQPSPTLHDIGTLIKMRKERLEHSKQMRKTKSEDMLAEVPPKEDWSHSDLAHRQLRKEFHLSQYTERRSSWSQEVRPGPSKPEGTHPQEEPRAVHLPVQVSVKVDEDKRKPRGPEEDYPERLMSPPPTKEPRSILKSERSQQRYDYRYSSDQQYQHQHYEEFREVRQNGARPPSERDEPPPPPAIQSHPHHTHGPAKPTTAPPPPPAQPMRPRSTTFQDLPEEERYRIMQENLMKHRQHRPTTPKQHTANFNGPFFRLEEVTPGASGQQPYRPPTTNGYSLNQMKSMSQSEMELEQHFHRNEEPHVVVWPPPNDKNRPRSQSVMSKSMMDPERIEELRRQQAMEREAMKRHEDEKMKSMAKQIRAMQIQQERLYEQQHGVTSPVPMMSMGHEDPNAYMTDMEEEAPDPQTQNMRIFETRPISSMSENVDMPTWKRTYVVNRPDDVAKNEILTSDELLQREQYEVDILKRREAFVEKPDMAPELQRTGKRWQPPPDKPYVWPTLRRPISVEPHLTSPIDFPPGPPQEDDEYKWAPVINDPGYRRERKNFTPTHSPPPSPRRGMNTLDEVNKRQTKYVVQPSPDGSHRPKPAFRKERHPPHGGFYPHAPNAIKVVKRRAASVQNLNSPNMEHEDIEVIAHRNYHRVDPVYQQHPPSRSASAVDHRLRRDSSHHSSHHELSGLNEWEKIYELPPHSSTIVGKDVPRNVDVRRRLNQFEGSIQNLAERKHLVRATSVESSNSQPFPPPDYDLTLPTPTTSDRHQVSRRNSVASGHHDAPRRERRSSRPQSRAPSSILLSPTPRGDTPGAQRARAHIARSTAASPTPPSYDRARAYQPPALPPGYRLADPPPDMRAISPQPGHTKRMVRTVQDSTRRMAPTPQTSRAPSRSTSAAKEPPKTDDLDQLGRRTAELEERSRAHRSSYKLIDSEIHKTAPAPMPSGLKDQVNELLASRASLNTVEREHDRSGYATDVSTATWQFSTHSFSPRSVVSMNGARDDILKSRVPADLESITSSARTAPAAFRVVSSSLDDKPRSIMKRRELESREQMMYPSNQQLVEHKSYQRSQSNVAKPTVTETVQRFEETRRTEEVERRVQRKERRERRSRHHSSSRHGQGWGHDAYLQEQRRVASLPRQIVYQQANRAMTADEMDQVVREAYEAADDARRHGTRVRSNSLSRALPSTQEAYYRQTTTKRDRDYAGSRYEDEAFGRGLAHARYGSLSDSLRRGELKYIPNGEVRESGHFGDRRNVHKSYSTRDVFNNDYDRRSVSSQRRGSQQVSPFVEFPPTLPRRSDRDNYRPISKSRSYADWDDQGRAGFGGAVRRYDDLEAEFRDSLLMPMPRGNMNERDHRTENIPGGYETFDKNKKAQTGRRLGREGQPVDFHESSQEYNYKREQEMDRRR